MTCNVPRMFIRTFDSLAHSIPQGRLLQSGTLQKTPWFPTYFFVSPNTSNTIKNSDWLKGTWLQLYHICCCLTAIIGVVLANKTTNEHQQTKEIIHLVLDVSSARFWAPVLLMGQKSRITTCDGAKTLKNNGIFTISTGDCRISGCHQPYFITQTRKNTVPWCPRKLGRTDPNLWS